MELTPLAATSHVGYSANSNNYMTQVQHRMDRKISCRVLTGSQVCRNLESSKGTFELVLGSSPVIG